MKICNQCNLQYEDNKNFCKGCGSRLVIYQEISQQDERLDDETINEGFDYQPLVDQFLTETNQVESPRKEPLEEVSNDQPNSVILKKENTPEFYQLPVTEKRELVTSRNKVKKRKYIIAIALVLVVILFSCLGIVNYFNVKDKNAFEQAKKENTLRSYQFYIYNYPKGKYSQKSLEIQDEIFWNIISIANTPMSFDEYLCHYPSGKHSVEAKNKLEELNGYTIKFTYLNSNDGVKLSRIKILTDKTEVRLYISQGGTLYKPNDNKAFFIRDNMSGRKYNLTSASEFGRIPSNSFVNLYFEKIPYSVKTFDIIEGNAWNSGWHINEIILKKEFLYESNF
jgi:hypothetical protein